MITPRYSRFHRASQVGFILAICALLLPVEQARSQSIQTDGDIVGNGISLLQLRELVCDNAAMLGVSPVPDVCSGITRFVFVTSAASTSGGNLVAWASTMGYSGSDGLEAGDAICQHHADNATPPLPGTYKAWLSTDTVDAKDRIGSRKWVLPDGTTAVADSLADLLECTPACLQAKINLDENQASIAPLQTTYTGTQSDGTSGSPSYHCNNWTTESSSTYRFGQTSRTDYWWTDNEFSVYSCNVPSRLYCFGN